MAINTVSIDKNLSINFNSTEGEILLGQYRMLLLHTETFADLRKELIDSLGVDRARGLITRMGYASGQKDAALAKKLNPNASDDEIMSMGPELYKLQGAVKASAINVKINIMTGKFYGEYLCQNSYEAKYHMNQYGIALDPVCWTQIGYATGYTSALMRKFILYKEIDCIGCGSENCRIIGKPIEEWTDNDQDKIYFELQPIADQIIQLQSEIEILRSTIKRESGLKDIIGNSPKLLESYELLTKVVDNEVTVMLSGETGVGKELFARALHNNSNRKDNPFVAVNCAAIPEDLIESELFGVEKGAFTGAHQSRPGRFERAHGGTLFLDEIDQLSGAAQAKLLRVIQDGKVERVGDVRTRKVNVRLVVASNKGLDGLVKEGKFRADLYFRMSVYPIVIPSLRERHEDIPILTKHFIKKFNLEYNKNIQGVSKKVLDLFMQYHWPGNIREFENVIERGVILAENNGKIDLTHLSLSKIDINTSSINNSERETNTDTTENETSTMGFIDSVVNNKMEFKGLPQLEADLLNAAIKKTGGNICAAAKLLNLTRPQLSYRLKKLNLN